MMVHDLSWARKCHSRNGSKYN